MLRLDTEDYITPESNDAALAIAEALFNCGVRATFPLVGEKIRFLRDCGREDVLHALNGHELGYHTNLHSFHPTVAERLEDLGWESGRRTFEESERAGIETFADVFDRVPSCYTQAGGNWVPHAYPALRKWGIRFHYSEGWNSYLDFGPEPYFYGGVLSWSAPVPAPKPFLSGLPENLEEAKRQFDEAYEQITAAGDASAGESANGFINIVAHPTELISLEFWDAVNFGRGRNTPKGLWRSPRLRSASDVKAALSALVEYVTYTQAKPGVQFITAGEFIEMHPDPAYHRLYSRDACLTLAGRIGRSAKGESETRLLLGPQGLDEVTLSAAEVFTLLVLGLDLDVEGGVQSLLTAGAQPLRFVWGPETLPSSSAFGQGNAVGSPSGLGKTISWEPFLAAWSRVRQDLISTHAVPPSVEVNGLTLLPEEFLVGVADAWLAPSWPPESVTVRPVTRAFEQHVKQVDRLHWDWPIFRPDFRPMNLLEATRAQSWTFKPVRGRFTAGGDPIERGPMDEGRSSDRVGEGAR